MPIYGAHAGESVLEKLLKKAEAAGGTVSGADAFLMYDTYGFPLELTQEVAADRGLAVDEEGFEVAMKEQRTRSKVCCRLLTRILKRWRWRFYADLLFSPFYTLCSSVYLCMCVVVCSLLHLFLDTVGPRSVVAVGHNCWVLEVHFFGCLGTATL